MTSAAALLARDSFVELDARGRIRALFDGGRFRELIDPFERVTSPWLLRQGVVTQSDDGVVVAKGEIEGQPAVILAIEGAFQGGSLGEVGGAKIAGALELAVQDNERGIPTRALILLKPVACGCRKRISDSPRSPRSIRRSSTCGAISP